ncbi:hypothetical protein MJO29_008218 [Puccinia striiformis f. sp. tritici]|uniref:SUZ domain-containing protein n=1 Tax=Puccinia striiformis TaxID=27350 RepID=A0A2S4UMR0_9BASI|nr:hypothetical protein Pst134EB_016728 [Puccinia striiformis f. sp. tritici]KAI7952587.1 hypothetical protein MJO29_008218 [Puccinia striiformis f. sp. tritici]POV98549.1 hypothetical protein PSHT_13964 [Puccinia striiformis]
MNSKQSNKSIPRSIHDQSKHLETGTYTNKLKKADPCEDWEDQDYDSPINDSIASTANPVSSTTNLLSSSLLPSSSMTLHSKLANPIELENSMVWNNANRNPQYVILPANASHSAVTANRPLAQETMFGKPKVTILKRPQGESKTRSSTHSNSSSSSNLSIGLREKAYSEARERIFGSLSSTPDEQPSASSSSRPITSSKSSALPQTSLDSSSSVNLVGIQRQPNGPISTDQKGFNSRQKIIPA